jgi:hypothetical protein
MTTMKKVGLVVRFQAYRAAGVTAVPDSFGFLRWKNYMKKLEGVDQAIRISANGRP